MEKRVKFFSCLFLIISVVLIMGFLVISPEITGNVGSSGATGYVSFQVLPSLFNINITEPRNITYNFSKTDEEYILNLNVSSDVDNIETWKYNLEDLRHDEIIIEDVSFIPNITFNAVRWENKLTVIAENEVGQVSEDSVEFFIFVPNTAPRIYDLFNQTYVCEGEYLEEIYYIEDVDEDDVSTGISPRINFYTEKIEKIGNNITKAILFSGILDKSDLGGTDAGFRTFSRTVWANDDYSEDCCVDTQEINITILEINNFPSIEDIGVKTLWTQGENSSLNKSISVSDEEDGDRTSPEISFNISFNEKQLFNISDSGVINYNASLEDIGNYNITICAIDSGIENPHENISLCDQDGGPLASCDNFSLTITDENRAPTIIDYFNTNLSFSVLGTENIYFNITKYDPDGTIPDTYWKVDGIEKKYDSGSFIDEFTYEFGCGVKGDHIVEVEITDGLQNDSIEWNVLVENVPCPEPVSGGGGSGGGMPACEEKWICEEWSVCQNIEKSLDKGFLSGEDYRQLKNYCNDVNWKEGNCGVQLRTCTDLNNCSTEYKKPLEFQSCFYVSKPSCFDGIKNCHNGSCELLVDCGGPCQPCPTCSDGIKNQGEERVDCGGPCPPCKEQPLVRKNVVYLIILIILNLIIIFFAFKKLRKIFNLKKEIEKIKKT